LDALGKSVQLVVLEGAHLHLPIRISYLAMPIQHVLLESALSDHSI
jgi:hypothetical protein